MGIRVVTPPAVEPISLQDVKTHSHISHSEEDSYLLQLIRTGRTIAEMYQNRAFITQTIDLSFDGYPSVPFYLNRSPVQSVTSITLYDVDNVSTVYSSSNYFVDTYSNPARIDLKYNSVWPSTTLRSISGFVVRYIAGYGNALSVPDNVKDAIMLYVGWRLENRSSEVEKIPESFYALLSPDRLPVYEGLYL